jgi:chromosome segregation ATPase
MIMGHGKSPVDELVDGIDAIGSILDENLPEFKTHIENLIRQGADGAARIAEMKGAVKDLTEEYTDLRKLLTNVDVRLEELLAAVNALSRRFDVLQKTILETTVQPRNGGDSELSDTVKMLEDRLKRLELKGISPDSSA